jgi:hypothetical protein
MFEVDSANRKISAGRFLTGSGRDDAVGIESDRALMIDGDVYYWVGGVLNRGI